MSHSTVLVIGPDPEAQLAPYDENAHGDCPKEYMEFEDGTEKVDTGWETGTVTEYQRADGEWVGRYDEELGAAMSITNENPYVPKERKVPVQQHYADKEHYAEDYLGYRAEDMHEGAYGYWHNPNARWDWYQLGGRWSGFFAITEGGMARLGERSWMRDADEDLYGRADQAYMKDIDWGGMQKENNDRAAGRWTAAMADRPAEGEDDAIWKSRYGIRENETKQGFIVRESRTPTFAVLKDGVWYERGRMGWWGMVSDEKDGEDWGAEWDKLVMDLPGDTLLSVYDVHI